MKEAVFFDALIKRKEKEILAIYTKSFPAVKKFVMQNKGAKEDAEDVFQRALLQLAVRYKKEKFEITTSFEAYLFTVCKNLWRRELNKHKKRVTNNEIFEQYVDEYEDSLALVEQKRQELFLEKLGVLTANCKKILTLFFAKTSYAEIMKETEYNSESVIRQRVFKCKKKLTELIKKDKRYTSLKDV